MGKKWTMETAATEKAPGLHPFAGARWGVWARHVFCTQGLSSRSRYQRFISSVAQTVRFPNTVYEMLAFGRRIRETRLEKPPVFLVGHWRSGTTHLHNLMSRDPQFGFLQFSETAMPLDILGPLMSFGVKAIDRALPATRGYDNVKLTLEEPQEEEMALGNLNPLGYYLIYYFPQYMALHRDRSMFFEETTERERENFRKQYEFLLRKITVAKGGRQLLLKNPPSTTRMPLILDMFPDAKFVHIVRNPWPVFRSTVGKFPRLFNAFAWQDFLDVDTVGYTLETYEKVMRRYVEDREKLNLPSHQLVETTYEDITRSPIEEIGRIYDQLGLDGKDTALKEIGGYLQTIKDYKRNRHRVSAHHAEEVRKRWAFSFEEWGYPLDPPDDIEIV